MEEIKYYARVIKTGEWVEIDEFHYNALFLGASWGIYYQAKCVVNQAIK